jgi:hypothetical protein
MNIIDAMDAARFTSANPDDKTKRKQTKKDSKDMPDPVLRDLNNK